MKVMVSGGGTGGHVYPALAAVQSLTRQCAEAATPLETLWVGSRGGMEQALVERAGLKIESIQAGGLRGKNPVAAAKGLWLLGQGYRQSAAIIRRFRPDALLVTGGYVCVPVTLAASRASVPVVIYLPDIEPGLAIKFLARFAQQVAVTTADSRQFFRPGLAVVTGYPIRPELAERAARENARIQARQQFDLGDEEPVLLVFGGSRGARSINRAVAGDIERYLKFCQVLHITGSLDEAWVRQRREGLPPPLRQRYHVFAYLHRRMVDALLAADLVVSRAGASVMGEFPAAGLPAILVPYPYAGAHQALNANYLARHQAALIVDDPELENNLADTTIDLLTNKQKLEAMRSASKALANLDAADRLARVIREVQNHGN